VRTFGRLRAELVNGLGVARHEVRPATLLEALIPVPQRREIWRRMRRQGLRVPPLELTAQDSCWHLLVILKTAVSFALWLGRCSGLLVLLPLGLLAFWVSRRQAVHFPEGVRTVGELTLYSICFADHKASGYRWTSNEISFEVRLAVAEAFNLPLDAVRPETKLAELDSQL
jgi:hypothetical protein